MSDIHNGGHTLPAPRQGYVAPPLPTNLSQSIELLHEGGPDFIKAGIQGLEKFDPNPERSETVKQIVHPILNSIGYLLEQLYDLPDGYFGAGGGGKGGGSSGGGG